MWHDHLFSQRNKATERAVRVEAGGIGSNEPYTYTLSNIIPV